MPVLLTSRVDDQNLLMGHTHTNSVIYVAMAFHRNRRYVILNGMLKWVNTFTNVLSLINQYSDDQYGGYESY